VIVGTFNGASSRVFAFKESDGGYADGWASGQSDTLGGDIWGAALVSGTTIFVTAGTNGKVHALQVSDGG